MSQLSTPVLSSKSTKLSKSSRSRLKKAPSRNSAPVNQADVFRGWLSLDTYNSLLEPLEQRIAPAGVSGVDWKPVTFDTPILLTAGQGLATSSEGGAYLMYVESGQALVYLTDMNNNGQFDPNEITGIAAGDGLRITSFVNINGDIVTNLNADGTLTDLDPSKAGNDGLVLLNSRIDSIVLRSLTADDTPDYLTRMAPSTYSIYGNIFAGGGLGTSSNDGLIIDTSGWSTLLQKFNGGTGSDWVSGSLYPSVGYILTGTATSGKTFSFGVSGQDSDVRGQLSSFSASAGQIGGDVLGIRVGDGALTMGFDPETGASLFTSVPYQIVGIATGNGGTGARGGDISNVMLNGDVGGFFAIAGNGGDGQTGGRGGSIANLSDLGSYNVWVTIHAGDGGNGYSGFGGSGGAVTLGQFSTTGNVSIILGNGGDGAAGGGNGAGLGSAAFTPVTVDAVPIPMDIISTYRQIGLDDPDGAGPLTAQASSIGTPLSIDFNGDGGADIVYIAQNPNQLVVRLGVPDGNGGFIIADDSPTYYLSAPKLSLDRSAGVVVGDFNADGFLDIAIASNEEFSRDGIHVFLWNNEIGGFDLPLYSNIPFFNLGSDGNFLRSGGAITNLVAGDFNGDGVMDLAFLAQYYASTSNPRTALVTMSGAGDGYFYADFSYNAQTNTRGSLPILNVSSLTNGVKHAPAILQATAIDGNTDGLQKDALVFAFLENEDSQKIFVIQDTVTKAYPDGQLSLISSDTGMFRERSWDSNTSKVEFANIAVAQNVVDFVVMDVDGNGIFDVVSLNPNGSIVAFKGDADGKIEQIDGDRGILLTGEFGVLPSDSAKLNSSFRGILTGNFDGDNTTSNIAIYNNGTGTTLLGFYTFTFDSANPFVQSYAAKVPAGGVSYLDESEFEKPTPTDRLDTSVQAFAIYQGHMDDDTKAVGFALARPQTTRIYDSLIQIGGGDNDSSFAIIYNVGFFIEAGDGGNSQLGAGGNGGSFGSGTVSINESGNLEDMPIASVTVLIPGGSANFSALFEYVAGDGGNGFTAGGAGGTISGLAARYIANTGALSSSVHLLSGSGGDSVLGTAGSGGNISNLSVLTLEYAKAGDGGFGMYGGTGGSILGNGQTDLYDSRNAYIQLIAGDGGDGIKSGGAGGSILNYHAGFLRLIDASGGFLSYSAGDGGNALAGKGGAGGSVTNSSPENGFNYLVGDISVRAGNGGNGLTGGIGGSISNFVNKPSDSTNLPKAVSFIAGDGGSGISGAGGNGGSISKVTISSTGLSDSNTLLYNRYIAGDGGTSYGAAGGNGGSISSLNVSSTAASLAVAAGAGGDGLTRGGHGGSVSSLTGSAAGALSKVLIVAGDGGDAYAFLATSLSSSPNPQQVLTAFGGVAGVGGNGGDISRFSQTGGVDVATDLIAGNGGSLLNYGSPTDLKPNVGRGGSISNITLAGNAGSMAEDQEITSYYTTTGYDNMSEFVTNWLAQNGNGILSNTVGNVGIVAGAAGRVSVNSFPAMEGLPANNGINGSVTSITARNIMSMVAGSVERISAIQTLNNITLASGGIAGAYKNAPIAHPSNSPLYFDSDSNQTSVAAPGGALMDGAVLVRLNNSGLTGLRIFSA